jgi:uncharacterized protein
MPPKPRLWRFRIHDIIEAIQRIEAYVSGMTLADFESDRRTLDAVERNFIAIGEAAGGVPEEVQQRHPGLPWQEMRAMRNFVVHVYWGVEPRRLWDTIHSNLPDLVPALEHLLEDEGD